MTHTDIHQIATGNGLSLTATFFHPQHKIRAAVLIVPAMGVAQKYYAPLAAWLATQGFLVATFDFSGIGLSRSGDLRKHKGNVIDWARFECPAMIDAITAHAPDKPLYWIGHSLGGQILGFVPNRERITKAITIACGSGYWLESVPRLRWKVWWLWYVMAPLSMRMFGYYPGKRLHMIGDLPRGVMTQWRSWCLNPEYAMGVEGAAARAQFAEFRAPITSISFTDDEFMSARNVESLHGFYTNAPRNMKRYKPLDVGVERVGHFGFFNARFEQTLWQTILLPELS
jgi:predicted alpha/beta hydrolase